MGYFNMNLGICFDIAAISVLLTLVLSLNIRKLTKGRANIVFLALICVVLGTAVCDLWIECFGNLMPVTEYNLFLRQLLTHVYVIFRSLNMPMYLLYLCNVLGVWHKIQSNRVMLLFGIIPYAVALVVILTNPFTKGLFYFESDYSMHFGPNIVALYLAVVIYYFIGLYLTIRYAKHVENFKVMILLLFFALSATTIVIQYFAPHLRVEMFMSSLILLIISIGVQRPDEMIDTVVNAQSYKAFLNDMEKAYTFNRPINVILVKVTNQLSLRNYIGFDGYINAVTVLAKKIQQIAKLMNMFSEVYYLDYGTFAVVSDEKYSEGLMDIGRILLAFADEPIDVDDVKVDLELKLTYVRCPQDIDSMGKLVDFTNNFHKSLPDKKGVIILEEALRSKDFKIRNDIDSIINRAIRENRFEMYYQPIYSIKSGTFTSAEALIRLKDDEFGFVSPAIFIPAAERSGAIHQIGDFVFKDVLKFIADNRIENFGLSYIEINLSVAQCIERNLVDKVRNYLKESGVNSSKINLEITETAADYDRKLTDSNIKGLASMGISFSLDDYGTGYSNIRRVASMPLDIVKLDKSLVDEMNNPNMMTVIRNTISMLKKLNKKILVEGVETEEAFKQFVELDCDYIQGYYFSRPLPTKEFIEFVNRENHKEQE